MSTPIITAPALCFIKWISEVTLAHFYKEKRRNMQVSRVAFFASFLKVNCAKGARETPLGDFDKRNEGTSVYVAKL